MASSVSVSIENILKGSSSDYNFLFFNVKSVEEADTLLFAESHTCQTCKSLFSKLLSEISQNFRVTVYLEGETRDSTYCLQSHFRENIVPKDTPAKKEHIFFSGWDHITNELRRAQGNFAALQMHQLNLLDMQDKVLSEIDSICDWIHNYPGVILDSDGTLKDDCILRLMRTLDDVGKKELLEKIQRWASLKKKNVEILRFLDDLDSSRKNLEKQIDQEMPKRTASSVEALKALRIARETGDVAGKALFQMGKGHLKTLEKDQDKPEYDLTPLYSELGLHRAVILIPKDH